MSIWNWLGKKRGATPGGDKSIKPQDLEALEKIIRYDPNVVKRQNAVQAVVEAARMFRTGLDGISMENKIIYTMAASAGQHYAEEVATTNVGKYAKGIVRASLVLLPTADDADAVVRAWGYNGLAEVAASQMVDPEVLGYHLTQGMKDAEASVRIAAATSLGELIKFFGKVPGQARAAVAALVNHLEDPDQAVRKAVRVALQHGIKGIPADTLASRLADEDIWRRAAEAIRESQAGSPYGESPTEVERVSPKGDHGSASEAVESLLTIYAANPGGFAPGCGDPSAKERARQVGQALNLAGGMGLMRLVHAEFGGRCRISGAARNLEHTWDGIGDWRG